MKNIRYALFSLILLIIAGVGCKEQNKKDVNPSVPVMNIVDDEKALGLINEMTEAMGGRDQWDNLKYVSWTFFGARHLVWDKSGSRVRIDSPRDSMVYLIDLHNHTGKVTKGGIEVEESELDKWIDRGEGIWINDSYWLFMPFKLRDPGVNVAYMRSDTIMGGKQADVLELTFDNVGNTPDNKYEVYIDKEEKLIKQWAFFKSAQQDSASMIWPWDNYQTFGGLKLSSDRSDKKGPSNVRIYDTLDDKVFESFEAFDYF